MSIKLQKCTSRILYSLPIDNKERMFYYNKTKNNRRCQIMHRDRLNGGYMMLKSSSACNTLIKEKLKSKILTLTEEQQYALLIAARKIRKKSLEQKREFYGNARQTEREKR